MSSLNLGIAAVPVIMKTLVLLWVKSLSNFDLGRTKSLRIVDPVFGAGERSVCRFYMNARE